MSSNLNQWTTTSVLINRLWQLRLPKNSTDGQWHISLLVFRYTFIYIYKRRYDLCKSQLNLNIITTCIYIDGKMVVYIITIHIHIYTHTYTYIYWIYDLGRVLLILYCHFYITRICIYNHMNIKKKKSEIFIFYQLILISCMNTYDNLCNLLLTIIIIERRCLND